MPKTRQAQNRHRRGQQLPTTKRSKRVAAYSDAPEGLSQSSPQSPPQDVVVRYTKIFSMNLISFTVSHIYLCYILAY